MTRILFVCHGNICRSPMAEFIFKDMVQKRGLQKYYEIDSAATSMEETGNPIYYLAKAKLREKGIPFTEHYAHQVRKGDYDRYDYIILMDRMNIRWLNRIIPKDPDGKIRLLLETRTIEDPWYTRDFETAYLDIVEGCELLLEETEKERQSGIR